MYNHDEVEFPLQFHELFLTFTKLVLKNDVIPAFELLAGVKIALVILCFRLMFCFYRNDPT